jgi:hypothetical protein
MPAGSGEVCWKGGALGWDGFVPNDCWPVGAGEVCGRMPPAEVAFVQACWTSAWPVTSVMNWRMLDWRWSGDFDSARMIASFLACGIAAPRGCASKGVGGAVRCLVAHSHGVLAIEGQLAREHLVRDDAHGVDVRARVEG